MNVRILSIVLLVGVVGGVSAMKKAVECAVIVNNPLLAYVYLGLVLNDCRYLGGNFLQEYKGQDKQDVNNRDGVRKFQFECYDILGEQVQEVSEEFIKWNTKLFEFQEDDDKIIGVVKLELNSSDRKKILEIENVAAVGRMTDLNRNQLKKMRSKGVTDSTELTKVFLTENN